jgi:Uma2 family endonuclease
MATLPTIANVPTGTIALPAILTLQQGDHLTREEFERRYEAMPHVNKAELVEGVVHMPSPVIYQQHGKPHFDLIFWLGCYVMNTPGTEGGDSSTLKLDLKNEPQPDAFLIIPPRFGGQVKFDDKGYIVGAPELIGEVSASSASYDLHTKLEAYRRNGVKEYVVWRVLERSIDWFVLVGDQYQRMEATSEGWFKCRVFPGLWLDAPALFNGQLLKVFQVVQQGVATPEHQDFVHALQQRCQSTS